MNRNYINQLKGILAVSSLTQGQLADRLGVTFAALNRWVHGYARPHRKRIVAIEKLYREVVGYPSITDGQLRQAIRKAAGLKIKGLWGRVAHQQELQDELLLEHTYNSTSIEGTTFTKRETQVVIFSKGLIPDKSLIEHLEVMNHATVLRRILQKKYQASMDGKFIQDLHRDLMYGIREDAGLFSKHQRVIHGASIALTHPKDIPEEMARLIRDWKKGKKTIKEIAEFHVRFELIHPFGDGNGRVGRLLMAFQCLQADYPPAIIEDARKADYYDVLEYAQRKSERPFVLFLVEEMERTCKMLQRYL